MLKKKNVNTIFDFSVESSKNISRNIDEIYKQINVLESSFIALKFSSLGINNESLIFCQKLIDNFYKENSKKKNPNKFLIDAENYIIQPKIYDLSDYAIDNYNTPENKYFYKTLQMYRNDVSNIFYEDIEKYIENNKYALKLVRGAYISSDKKHNIILSSKEDTDTQYNYILNIFLSLLHEYPKNDIVIATHNNLSYNMGISFIKENTEYKNNIYFATLLGMADNICFDDNNYNKLKYVPYGPFFETTPYLFRRFIENKDIIKYI
tara:strand:- start:2038 stop:2832 length:795 start_codon:yes stop_codon:yes gene_type:complete